MKEIEARLSTKGQLTLPKTIRDILKLSTGDYVKFKINNDGSVLMEKGKHSIILENGNIGPICNSLNLFFNIQPLLTITGNAATGKTTFAARFILDKFKYKKVGVVEESNHLSPLLIEGGMTDIIVSDNFEGFKEKDLDLIVIEEFTRYLNNIEEIKELIKDWIKKDIKVILIGQKIRPTLIRDHISVKLSLFRDDITPNRCINVENITFDLENVYKEELYIG